MQCISERKTLQKYVDNNIRTQNILNFIDFFDVDLMVKLNVSKREFENMVKSPTSDRTLPDNVFISGGNHRITSRFCGVVLGPTTIFKMLSQPLQDPWIICYQVSAIGPPTIYVHEPSPIVLVVMECVKSPTSDRTWPDNVFIRGGNPHLTVLWGCVRSNHHF